jgi:hypothetical protein
MCYFARFEQKLLKNRCELRLKTCLFFKMGLGKNAW